MGYRGFTAAAGLAVIACTMFALSGAAAAGVRYVSTSGDNANNCTLTAPCRTVQRGIKKTPAGGELHILDSGWYGNSATINASITIVGHGHTVILGSPIVIDAAGAVVALRRLALNGRGSIARGVEILAGAVHIEGCVVHGFTDDGVFANSTNAPLAFIDSIARDNGGAGVFVFGDNGEKLTVDNARFENNARGLFVRSFVRAAINRSVAANNTGEGYLVHTGGPVTLESSHAYANGTGLRVNDEFSEARISNSTFVNNGTGIFNDGTLRTRRNNTVDGNGTNISGAALTSFDAI